MANFFQIFLIHVLVLATISIFANRAHAYLCMLFAKKLKSPMLNLYLLNNGIPRINTNEKYKSIVHSKAYLKFANFFFEFGYSFFFAMLITSLAYVISFNSTSFTLLSLFGSVIFFIISYIKFRVLKEPIIWTDFALIKEMIICPRFYFSYVPKIYYLLLFLFIVLFLTFSSLLEFYEIEQSLKNKSISIVILLVSLISLFLFSLSHLFIFKYIYRIFERANASNVIISNETNFNETNSNKTDLKHDCIEDSKEDFKEEIKNYWLPITYDNVIDSALFTPLNIFCVTLTEALISKPKLIKVLKNYDLKAEEFLKKANINNLKINNNCLSNKFSNVVLIQAESLVDLKRLSEFLSKNANENEITDKKGNNDNLVFDDCFDEQIITKLSKLTNYRCSLNRGIVDVPYFGAYTMRSEFSSLTGIFLPNLGPYSYNPYLISTKNHITSIATILKKQGFTPVCIHPNFKGFFSRDKVLKQLGFDFFFDEDSLKELIKQENDDKNNQTKKTVAYGYKRSTDEQLFEKAIELLNDKSKKYFIFAITIDCHGPYGSYDEQIRNYAKKAQKSIEQIGNFLDKIDDNTKVVIYGDHLPPIDSLLNSVYLKFNEHSFYSLTPDVIIKKQSVSSETQETLDAIDSSKENSSSSKTSNITCYSFEDIFNECITLNKND